MAALAQRVTIHPAIDPKIDDRKGVENYTVSDKITSQ
jgi:hypothetical protein